MLSVFMCFYQNLVLVAEYHVVLGEVGIAKWVASSGRVPKGPV